VFQTLCQSLENSFQFVVLVVALGEDVEVAFGIVGE
jgi:hypothetical protein